MAFLLGKVKKETTWLTFRD